MQLVSMSKKSINHSPIINVEEELKSNAQIALAKMKNIEKLKRQKMKTIYLDDKTIVSSTSSENLKIYQKNYGKL